MTSIYTPEQKNQLSNQVSRLTSLPRTPSSPPNIESGTVALFADPSWTSKRVDLKISDYIAGRRQRVPSSIIDQATWVAWNLPIGTVMTMTDWTPSSASSVGDLSDAAGAIDLVGSGTTRSSELYDTRLNDGIAGFFWREVDLWQGAIELFADPDFTGNFSTIFLCEWPRETPINLTSWWLNDRTSSFRWKTLTDRQTATLFADPNGTGTRYDNIKGWGSFKEIAKAWDVGVNDCVSSFSWSSVSPKKEVIAPIAISASSMTNATQLSSYLSGNNRTSESQQSTISLTKSDAQTLTVETSDQNHVGMNVKLTQTFRAGAEGIATTETSVELGFTYDFTTTKTVSQSTTTTLQLGITQNFNVPPQKHFEANLTASIGTIPATEYQTTATRWYDSPVTGGERDSANNNWYKRDETVTFRLKGNLMSRTQYDLVATPLMN